MNKNTNDFAPAITLMFLAPLIAEVLPGATRFSSIFVFPVEICVWGGGALLIRYAVRRWQLPWTSMLFLALALAVAEECIIQQTSLAPLVIRLKGVTYARSAGINYVYLLWALIYESTFVVFVPICLVELIYPARKERPWISKGAFFAVIPLFLLGSLLAWYSWTHIARTKVFHLPVYTPPAIATILSLTVILVLIITALKNKPSLPFKTSPNITLLSTLPAFWAILLFALALLAFGIAPQFPPALAILLGLILVIAATSTVPRWNLSPKHLFTLLASILIGSMSVSFIGFIDNPGPDLYFKIIINIIAVVLLIPLASKTRKHADTSRQSESL
jgi:hypothetical protein